MRTYRIVYDEWTYGWTKAAVGRNTDQDFQYIANV